MTSAARQHQQKTTAPFLIHRAVIHRTRDLSASDLARGVIAGLVGGLIGTIAMTQFQSAWNKAAHSLKSRGQEASKQVHNEPEDEQNEDATMKAAGRIAALLGRQLSFEQKKRLGPVVHYSFGTLQGGLYGAALDRFAIEGGLLHGAAFGATLFVMADEVAVPALGLAGNPADSPLSSHIYALASHLVYGVTTEVARRRLRAALER
jgi:putative membrane protein